mgnify:CR=1 FL=1
MPEDDKVEYIEYMKCKGAKLFRNGKYYDSLKVLYYGLQGVPPNCKFTDT